MAVSNLSSLSRVPTTHHGTQEIHSEARITGARPIGDFQGGELNMAVRQSEQEPFEEDSRKAQNLAYADVYRLSRAPVRTCARRRIPTSDWVLTFACVVVSVMVFWWLASQAANITRVNDDVEQLSATISTIHQQNASLAATVHQSAQPLRILTYADKTHMHQMIPIAISTTK